MTLMGEARFVLGIPLQLDRNRFESPSLLDSENLTEQRQRRFTEFKDMVKELIRYTSSCHVERSLTLSWPDKSFRPRSLVARFRPGTRAGVRNLDGSKDVQGTIGVSPRAG